MLSRLNTEAQSLGTQAETDLGPYDSSSGNNTWHW